MTLLVRKTNVIGKTNSKVVENRIRKSGKFQDGLPRTIEGKMGKVYVMFPAILKRGVYYTTAGTPIELTE